MKNISLQFLLSLPFQLFAQDTFQLAPPLLKYNTVFFADKTTVEIKFAQSQTAVHYTLNNQEPTINDPVYKKPVILKNNFTTIKAKAFGNNFHSSETAAVTFIKEGIVIQSTQQTVPDKKYPGSGAATLTDNKGGIARNSSNTWMGYNCDTVTVTINLAKAQHVKHVLLNFLQNESSWIFMPDVIAVFWLDKKSKKIKPFGKEVIAADTETPGSSCNYSIITAKNKIVTNKILIKIFVKKNIPGWHPAKGAHAWMFIDEIKVY